MDAKLCGEIADLARKYLDDSRRGGIEEIDRIILAATGDARWDDVSKWHRVRLRYIRFEQERTASAQLTLQR